VQWFFDWLYRVIELLVGRDEPRLKGGCSFQVALFVAVAAVAFSFVRWLL